MKQLIAPIAIIVALIAIFVIIDRKEFSRHDDVQTAQSESHPSNRKPLVSVPKTKSVTDAKSAVEAKPGAETKPLVETKPVVETKPAEVKPVAETKTADTKPMAETKTDKPAETKPVTETRLEEMARPIAVPVVTAEEAEKLNAEAMSYAEKHARKMVFIQEGMYLVSDDRIKNTTPLSIPAQFDDAFQTEWSSKRDELSRKTIPEQWTIDFNTLTENCDFEKNRRWIQNTISRWDF